MLERKSRHQKTEWKNVIEVIRHKTDKRIYRINQKFGETRVTEDHSLMADTHDGLVEIKAEQAPKFKLAQARMLPNENEVKEINVFDALKDYSQNIVYKGQKKIKNVKCDEESVWFNWMKDTKPVKVKKIIKTDTPEFESLCRLLAAYCAEGSSSTIETTSSRTGASIAGEEKWLEELKKDYKKLFSNVKTSVIRSTKKKRHLHYVTEDGSEKTTDYEDHTHKLQMMNALSAVFFKMFCGQKSTGKKLPEFIYNVPNEYKRIFLNKLLEGDGSRSVNKRLGYSDEYKKKNFSYTSQSTALVSGLSVLLRQLGINHSIHYREKKTAYAIKTSDKYNERVKTRITQEKYVGWVYDLSVEDNHTFVDACGQIVLHNTDSLMLLYGKGGEEKVKEFQKSVNAALPEKMELELEDFYPRGIFVAKKQEGGKGERGAKKKYALINREGKIKIRGFELVRRDWSRIARNTQREVLRILLSEGDVRKAVELVRETIARLKAGEVPLEECVVYTQLQKSTASYEIKSPELSAVLHGRKAGLTIPEGSVVAYVITKKGNSISEKAQVAELARDYDADYYINNQIMPAVLKILGALGVDAGDIKTKGTQSKLGGW
ncbi:MAG: DNA polymerase domain-containing protein [Candidatus Micrarchaeota archaeon]